jgi:O-acetyl-ADP-ribose deacetylase (regulator of RNase III)
MIEYKTGNILEEEADAVVNTVNCVGVMGRGIALQFKKAFPENFEAYAAACRRAEVEPGRMFVFETGSLTPPRFIINFPTKRHWRGKSRLEDIGSGLTALTEEIEKRGIRSVAVPPLGSGLGGLRWAEVRPLIAAALEPLGEVRVVIFEPREETARTEPVRTREVPKMTPGRAALLGLMSRYLAGLMDTGITLLEVHKLMYFLQLAGEPLRLRFRQAPYGPYAENLRHVFHAIEGYYVSGYGDGGDAPQKELQLVPGAIHDAVTFLEQIPDTHARFDRVADLVAGFESPFGLELLATVSWVASTGGAKTDEDVIRQTYAWSERKRQFSERQIRLALRTLEEKGWIPRDSAEDQ